MSLPSARLFQPLLASPTTARWVVLGCFTWAFVVRLRFLSATPQPVGVDGYYYAIQVRSLLESGELFYPASPLVFWWLVPFAALTDPIVGVKLGAAAGTAASVFPVYLLIQRLSGDRAAGVVGAAAAATSAQSIYLSTEFVKQGVGLTLTLAFLAALVEALARPTRPRMVLAISLLGLTLLAHKLAFAVALLVALPAFARVVWGWRPRARLGALIAAGLFGVALVCANGNGLAHTFHARTDFSFATLVRGNGARLFFQHEVRLAALAACLVMALWLRDRWLPPARLMEGERRSPVVLGFVLLCLVFSMPWLNVEDRQGLAMRLRLTAFLPLSVFAGLLFSRMFVFASGVPRATVCAASVAALFLLRPSRPGEGTVTVMQDRAEAVHELEGLIPPGALVITTDRHLAFMTTWHTRASARKSVPPRIESARTYRLMATAALDGPFWDSLDACRPGAAPAEWGLGDAPRILSGAMVLLTERCFQEVSNHLPAASQLPGREW
ncbi:ArnT family glycosyltransferase [Corallococcus terminator]